MDIKANMRFGALKFWSRPKVAFGGAKRLQSRNTVSSGIEGSESIILEPEIRVKHMFSLYALLGEGAPVVSTESLATELNSLFRGEEGFSLQYEQLPFAKHKSLTLRWGTWLARLSYEEGKKVAEDSAEISRILGSAAPPKLAGINKRIRAVFGDDDTREYTNQMIYLTDFLRGIKGAIVFDPQQKHIIQPPQQKGQRIN